MHPSPGSISRPHNVCSSHASHAAVDHEATFGHSSPILRHLDTRRPFGADRGLECACSSTRLSQAFKLVDKLNIGRRAHPCSNRPTPCRVSEPQHQTSAPQRRKSCAPPDFIVPAAHPRGILRPHSSDFHRPPYISPSPPLSSHPHRRNPSNALRHLVPDTGRTEELSPNSCFRHELAALRHGLSASPHPHPPRRLRGPAPAARTAYLLRRLLPHEHDYDEPLRDIRRVCKLSFAHDRLWWAQPVDGSQGFQVDHVAEHRRYL